MEGLINSGSDNKTVTLTIQSESPLSELGEVIMYDKSAASKQIKRAGIVVKEGKVTHCVTANPTGPTMASLKTEEGMLYLIKIGQPVFVARLINAMHEEGSEPAGKDTTTAPLVGYLRKGGQKKPDSGSLFTNNLAKDLPKSLLKPLTDHMLGWPSQRPFIDR